MDELVGRLLDDEAAWEARKELTLIGKSAVPSFIAALQDPQFHATERKNSSVNAPLDIVLEFLIPYDPDLVQATALPLLESPSNQVHKLAAIHLASLGRTETLPALVKLLEDRDGYIRAYVRMGVHRAFTAGRCSEEFRRGMYEALLNQCDQDWHGTLNDAPETVIVLDPARAAIDFASPRWLSPNNRNLYRILSVCNKADISLPPDIVRSLLDYSLPLAVGEKCYPHDYVVAAALEALARRIGDQARPLLERALSSEQKEIQESAAKGLAMLAGVDNPVNFVLERLEEVGFEGLTAPQRVVYCGWLFDVEVCNGGIMQFFGNTSGDHAVETLDALNALGHPEAQHALESAMKFIGPLSRESDRDIRLAAFEDRFEDLQARFHPLEEAYYRTNGVFRQRLIQFATQNAKHFR